MSGNDVWGGVLWMLGVKREQLGVIGKSIDIDVYEDTKDEYGAVVIVLDLKGMSDPADYMARIDSDIFEDGNEFFYDAHLRVGSKEGHVVFRFPPQWKESLNELSYLLYALRNVKKGTRKQILQLWIAEQKWHKRYLEDTNG